MIVQSLNLRNYRNYISESVSFYPGINFILGKNAQGKTNLLESLVYLSLIRSFRTNDEKNLIRNDQEFAKIQCVFLDDRKKEIGGGNL